LGSCGLLRCGGRDGGVSAAAQDGGWRGGRWLRGWPRNSLRYLQCCGKGNLRLVCCWLLDDGLLHGLDYWLGRLEDLRRLRGRLDCWDCWDC